MSSFFNYSQKGANAWHTKNALVFSLPAQIVTCKSFLKNTNEIRGIYKDKILKDYIYISSSGYKKDLFFRENQITTKVLSLEIKKYVSYFSTSNSNIFSNSYFRKYETILLKKYFSNKYLYLKYNKTAFTKIRSIFWSNYSFWNKSKLNRFFEASQSFYVKSDYKDSTFITNLGIVKTVRNDFFSRLVFTGLIGLIPLEIKYYFHNILTLFYLLLKFYHTMLTSTSINKNRLVYTWYLYTSLYKYSLSKFYQFLDEHQLKIRKSNKFLYRYTFFLKDKYLLIIQYYWSQFLANFTNKTNSLLNWSLFGDNKIFYETSLPETVEKLNKNFIRSNVSYFKRLYYLNILYYFYCFDRNRRLIKKDINYLFNLKVQIVQKYFLKYFRKYLLNFKNFNITNFYFNIFLLLFLQRKKNTLLFSTIFFKSSNYFDYLDTTKSQKNKTQYKIFLKMIYYKYLYNTRKSIYKKNYK